MDGHDEYLELVRRMRAREGADQVIAWLNSLSSVSSDTRLRLALHAVLDAGSKSFSHLLNALER